MAAVVAGALAVAGGLGAARADVRGLELQLQEIRTLIREKRYPLALESLRLVARQIQELRLESVVPAFPPEPPGWTSLAPLSLLEEEEIWSNRIVAQRTYVATERTARVDFTIDVHTPFAPAVALSFNPLVMTGDPLSRIVPIGEERALLRFNPDTGEGELRVLLGREILVTARGRGIVSPEILVDLARRVDYAVLTRKVGL